MSGRGSPEKKKDDVMIGRLRKILRCLIKDLKEGYMKEVGRGLTGGNYTSLLYIYSSCLD